MNRYVLLAVLVVANVATALLIVRDRHEHRLAFVAINKLDKARDELNIEFGRLQLEQAQAQYGVARSPYWPTVNGIGFAGATRASEDTTPVLPEEGLTPDDVFSDFSSGYLERGKDKMPKNAPSLPWRLNQDYRRDKQDMRQAPIDDGVLAFTRARELVEG